MQGGWEYLDGEMGEIFRKEAKTKKNTTGERVLVSIRTGEPARCESRGGLARKKLEEGQDEEGAYEEIAREGRESATLSLILRVRKQTL